MADMDSGVEQSSARTKRKRFNSYGDLRLLREVVATNPFSENQSAKWSYIADNFNEAFSEMNVDGRLCKDHTIILLNHFKSNASNLKRSGTEEDYDEKCHLLDKIRQMKDDFTLNEKNARKNKNGPKDTRDLALQIRQAALTAMINTNSSNCYQQQINTSSTSSGCTSSPISFSISPQDDHTTERKDHTRNNPRKRRKCHPDSDLLHYLEDKVAKEFHLKERQVDIDKDKLQLERERFEMDREERRARLEMEKSQQEMDKREREARLEYDKKQQDLMGVLLQSLVNKHSG